VSLAKCSLAGNLGAEIDLSECAGIEHVEDDIALFSESNGRFVVTVAASDEDAFQERFADLECGRVGSVTEQTRLLIRRGDANLIDESLEAMRQRFKEGLRDA